jgi:hypothetical protein
LSKRAAAFFIITAWHLRHHRLPDRRRGPQGTSSSTSGHLVCRSWRSSTDRLLRERCQTHQASTPNDDARLQLAQQHSLIEHSTPCNATCLEASWKVAQHVSTPPSHLATGSCATTNRRLSRTATKKPFAQTQHSRIPGAKRQESESPVRFCLHDSCDTDFRQQPTVCPAS